MDNRFHGPDSVENGGMFSREKIQQITQYFIPHAGSWSPFTAPMENCARRTLRGA